MTTYLPNRYSFKTNPGKKELDKPFLAVFSALADALKKYCPDSRCPFEGCHKP